MQIEQNPESRVEQHASWLAVNPVIGCPYGCEYCILGPDELRPQQPEKLVEPHEVLDQLLTSPYFDPNLAVAVGTRTDMFATKANQEYASSLLDQWEIRGLNNPLIFITKAKVEDVVADKMSELNKAGRPVIVFLSISGLDSTVERGVRHGKLSSNIPRLKDRGVPVVHYWRPLMPQNSTQEVIDRVHAMVNGNVSSSFIGGLRLTEEMKKQITGWPEILDIDPASTNGIWDEQGYDRVASKRIESAQPIYEAVSCTIANALSIPENNGVFNTKACVDSNCPSQQRATCSAIKSPDRDSINSVLSGFGLDDMRFTVDSSGIFLDGAVGEDVLTNLTLRYGINVFASQGIQETGYGWGNHHDRQQVFIRSREEKLDFFDLDDEGIAQLQKKFWGLKQEFKKTEEMPWNNLVFAGELNLQIGHLSSLMRGSEAKQYLPQVHDLADEAADIVFNVFNFATNSGVKISPESLRALPVDWTPDQLVYEITILGTVLWDAVAKADGYKEYVSREDLQILDTEHILNSILQNVCHFVSVLGLKEGFNNKLRDLVIESRKFINEKSKI